MAANTPSFLLLAQKERSKEKGSRPDSYRDRCGNCPKLIISPAEIGVEQMNLIEHFLSSALQNAVNDLGWRLYAECGTQ